MCQLFTVEIMKSKKNDLLYMIDICEIPVEYVKELPKTDLLLLVDGQYGRGNVYRFEADNIAMIDTSYAFHEKNRKCFIDYSYQSCSTIVWELLKEEGYDVKANEKLSIAFFIWIVYRYFFLCRFVQEA